MRIFGCGFVVSGWMCCDLRDSIVVCSIWGIGFSICLLLLVISIMCLLGMIICCSFCSGILLVMLMIVLKCFEGRLFSGDF